LIEIPAHSRVKLEIDAISGRMRADRILPESLAYPVNYGLIPCTSAGDGDALDVLVPTSAPLPSGTIVQVRPIAVLRMLDDGAEDDKLLAVPVGEKADDGSPLTTMAQLSPALLQQVRTYFLTYKEPGRVSVGAWENMASARRILDSSLVRSLRPNLPR